MKKATVSLLVLAGFASTSVMAQDAFSYAKGGLTWAHTKSDYLSNNKILFPRDASSEGTRDFGGVTLDLSKSFANNFYGRLLSEGTSAQHGNDSMGIGSLGIGVFTPLSTGLNLYGETGLMGYTMEREQAYDVKGWDIVTRKSDGSMYGEVGLRYDIGDIELSTAYRYANMTDDMHDFKVGGAYKLNQNWALTADYTYRNWDLQKGSISSLGVKYSF
ncbi:MULTISPECIES: autotransporter outer membrane beta-barrel domain-containing protein [Aeromonas]|uniref:autotransporter outer membrane beta-barrel domain-containing protein n=1 Tax=Aeromonas TaxID=642 RepID=UPI0005A99551|nr:MULTISPECIES: autotransporter outer membrane beta-barrel domain-containing protein [Aeromonas]MEB8284631.1 autotransporter outer membrane beta-barrel domain-containing protein [Aeromonas veronii]OLF20420.1 autotransporter [Aeromonas sp. YN13HZO-058]BBU06015.1 autotransporter [Aeromonas veronii]